MQRTTQESSVEFLSLMVMNIDIGDIWLSLEAIYQIPKN